MGIAQAIITLIGIIIQAGMQAQQEGASTADAATRIQNLVNEWARKQVADANFDAGFDPTSTAGPLEPPTP